MTRERKDGDGLLAGSIAALDRQAEGIDPDSIDTGEPIGLLRDYEVGTSPSFLDRWRRRVQRRQLAGQLAASAWETPKLLFVEILELIYGWLGSKRSDEGETK